MDFSDKTKRIIGMILIIVAFLAVGFFIRSFFSQKDDASIVDNEGVSQERETEEVIGGIESPENILKEREAEEVTFSNITSVLKYEIDSEIEDILNVKKFDEELLKFLTEKGKIVTASSEGNTTGLMLIKSTPYLTKSLKDGFYLFDLQIDDGNRSIVTVVTDPNGDGYAFELV